QQEAMLEGLRGQFALALWDNRRQRLVLARDRFGICPLYWTRQRTEGGEWLLFASEIKALLATGLVEPQVDPRGIHHLFTFFALPGRVTCFAGVEYLLPGRYLRIELGGPGRTAQLSERVFWEMDFPDRGTEEKGENQKQLVDEFERLLIGAT